MTVITVSTCGSVLWMISQSRPEDKNEYIDFSKIPLNQPCLIEPIWEKAENSDS